MCVTFHVEIRQADIILVLSSACTVVSLGNQTLGKSERRVWEIHSNVISVNYLPANAGLEDFYILHSGCTLISGKRQTV